MATQRPALPGNTLGDKIRQQREAKGWSQARLAQEVGTSQQTVNRIELGRTTHSRALRKILNLFEMDTASVLDALGFTRVPEADDLDFNSAATQPKSSQRNEDGWFPVFGSYFSGNLTSERPVSFINTPEPLINVRDAYGVIVSGVDMIPVLRPGDIALVNPHLPPREGDEVVFRSEGDSQLRFGTLGDCDADTVRFRTWNPPTEHQFARIRWPTCHLIVGKFNRS